MDIRRLVLYFLLVFIGMSLWNQWQAEHKPTTATQQQQSAASNSNQYDYVPTGFDNNSASSAAASTTKSRRIAETTLAPQGDLIHVTTDLLNVAINTVGGNVVSAALIKYPVSVDEKDTPVRILSPSTSRLYVAESGLTNLNNNKPLTYQATAKSYQLQSGQQQLQVVLTAHADGLEIKKTYTFTRDRYAIGLNYQVTNHTNKAWSGSLYAQLKRRNVPVDSSILHVQRSYMGAAYYTPHKPYQKLSYSGMDDNNLDLAVPGGWVAMQQHYFLSTWVATQNETNRYYSHVATPHFNTGSDHVYTIGFVEPKQTVEPGQTATSSATLYVGPETEKRLAALAKGLDLTIDYGWLWPISKLIFWVMSHIHQFIGNWGWSIVFTTLLIKLIFFKLTESSFMSMAKMRELTPRIQSLRERYGDDRQKLGQATMELYKKEKINPLGGCLPILIQIPVFIALYYVLIESVELRQAPFIFWIHDLSVKDPYYVLPILMGLSMFLQQRLSPAPPDPMQAKLFMFMPLMFVIFFMSFPAGLVLYWLANNCTQAAQQWYVMKKYEKRKQQKSR